MHPLEIKFWAGSQESLHAYVSAVAHLMESSPEKHADYLDTNDDQRVPDMYERQGSVGVISIKGSLTNSDSWMNAFTGAVSYNSIREALIYAANDAEAQAIVLDIQSGGGAVSGCSDTASLIKTIDAKVKPVHTFSDGGVMSAAYWLGCSARTITVGDTCESGSIGVLAVHKEMSKMLADDGITATVIRSGKFKALGSPYEALSDLAKEVLQGQVDKLAGMFTEYVAKQRGKTAAQVEATMGAGRVFIGSDAVDVGLVDGVRNFDAFMSDIGVGIDKRNTRPQYGAILTKGAEVATALTDQQIADAAAKAAAVPETPAVPAAPTEQVAATANPDVVALLQGQLATAQAQVLALSVEGQALKTANAALEAQGEKLRPAVRAAVGNLRIALGGSATGVEALNDDGLMAEHANLSAQFASKFPAGGVAAVSSTASAEKAGLGDDPIRKARLLATRPS